ncbi:MAG: spore coat associated protein CotJA [Hungatella sp.]|nr:spore coat associated protein CotJA [Hungatella sp.]
MACSYHNQAAGSQNTQPGSHAFYCPNTGVGGMEQYPVGMGYVPWQQWQQTYSLEQGFMRGTIFPDLDLTFNMGRCR